jgi:hypothetical protein
MFVALALLLSLAALLAVAYPVLVSVRRTEPAAGSAGEVLEELLAQRDAAFQALRDLNFDHQVGKITDEDFVTFEAHLRQAAADALRALDIWEAQADEDLALDGAVAARRAAFATPGHPCPACGRPTAAGDQFCTGCGQPLPEVQTLPPAPQRAICPHCSRPFEPGDRFCSGCGQTLPEVALVS